MKHLKILSRVNLLAWLMLLAICLFALPASLYAQDSTAAAEPTEEPAAEEPELISPSIEFISVQNADNSVTLRAAIQAKVNGTFYKLPKIKLSFLQVTDTAETALGYVITDRSGKAVFTVQPGAAMVNAAGELHFKVSYAGNKQMEAAEEEITVKKALLTITPVKGDSLLSVNVRLADMTTAEGTPVPETTVGIYVQRSLSALKIGEATTDENGEATVEIPNNLPGNAEGNITLLARVEENETYGNLQAAVQQKWGIAVSNKITGQPRALWSSHPPLWMLITFILLMGVVWGHYIVIVVQLFRLRKEEPAIE